MNTNLSLLTTYLHNILNIKYIHLQFNLIRQRSVKTQFKYKLYNIRTKIDKQNGLLYT
jgi:hypothetical protein